MSSVTFITGNPKKAEFLATYLGFELEHKSLDLDELQSLDLKEISEHKARQAFAAIGRPVLVEDISFSIEALGGLPGPFIKWFIAEVGFEKLCRLADLTDTRRATTAVCYVYFDGTKPILFEGQLQGTIPDHPRGSDGFGWNGIFIPDGSTKTNAEMNAKEIEQFSLRTKTAYPELRKFLSGLDFEKA